MPDAEWIDVLCRSARGVRGFKVGVRIFAHSATITDSFITDSFANEPRRQ
jgi:hypothetical protein